MALSITQIDLSKEMAAEDLKYISYHHPLKEKWTHQFPTESIEYSRLSNFYVWKWHLYPQQNHLAKLLVLLAVYSSTWSELQFYPVISSWTDYDSFIPIPLLRAADGPAASLDIMSNDFLKSIMHCAILSFALYYNFGVVTREKSGIGLV